MESSELSDASYETRVDERVVVPPTMAAYARAKRTAARVLAGASVLGACERVLLGRGGMAPCLRAVRAALGSAAAAVLSPPGRARYLAEQASLSRFARLNPHLEAALEDVPWAVVEHGSLGSQARPHMPSHALTCPHIVCWISRHLYLLTCFWPARLVHRRS